MRRSTSSAATSGMMPYERFDAWKATHQLALEVYTITSQWPKSERYELTSQVRRAALSAPTNIAEGAAKRGAREFRRYLDISLGSLSELSYLLRFGRDLGLLDDEVYEKLDQLRNRAGTLTWRLYACMVRARTPQSQHTPTASPPTASPSTASPSTASPSTAASPPASPPTAPPTFPLASRPHALP
jgi:four helix bundle protein